MQYIWFKPRVNAYVFASVGAKAPPAILVERRSGKWFIEIPFLPSIEVTYKTEHPPLKLALMALQGVGYGLAQSASHAIKRRVDRREETIAARPALVGRRRS